MLAYTPPLTDMRFSMCEVLDFDSHYASLIDAEHATPDTVDAILEEGARFARDVSLINLDEAHFALG